MNEGMMDGTREIWMAIAICGLSGWSMTRSARYADRPGLGFGVGVLGGIFMLLPIVALLPLYYWPEDLEWA